MIRKSTTSGKSRGWQWEVKGMNIDIPHGIMLTVSMVFKVRKSTTSEKMTMESQRSTQGKSQLYFFEKNEA